ncbi:MAG: fumarylacetoacetate hydrolase family protein [Cytophagales bacterium]|nr:fumarylacetoacetate hydrolase family protein [Armatimonadota bacterium]
MGGSRLNEAFLDAKRELEAHGLLTRFALPETARLLAPVTRPNRILAIGRNYAEHAKEQGESVFAEPIVFLKASTSVIGSGAAIEIPDWIGQVDFESELLVVLGKGGKNVREEEAMGLVAGYTVFNDVTARTQQKADQERKHPWFRSKSLDTFGPMGPYLVTADEVPDPHALRITCRVNGVLKQDDTTGSMVYRIPALIAFLSRWFALEAGDVIATGTPSGIGPIVPGDTVECSVEGVGILTNPVVAAS